MANILSASSSSVETKVARFVELALEVPLKDMLSACVTLTTRHNDPVVQEVGKKFTDLIMMAGTNPNLPQTVLLPTLSKKIPGFADMLILMQAQMQAEMPEEMQAQMMAQMQANRQFQMLAPSNA